MRDRWVYATSHVKNEQIAQIFDILVRNLNKPGLKQHLEKFFINAIENIEPVSYTAQCDINKIDKESGNQEKDVEKYEVKLTGKESLEELKNAALEVV